MEIKIPDKTKEYLGKHGEAYIILPENMKGNTLEFNKKKYKVSRIGFMNIMQFEKTFLKYTGYSDLDDLLKDWKELHGLHSIPTYIWVYRLVLRGDVK